MSFETGFLCSFGAFPVTSSCRPGWSRNQRYSPTSASLTLGLKACTTTITTQVSYVFKYSVTLWEVLCHSGLTSQSDPPGDLPVRSCAGFFRRWQPFSSLTLKRSQQQWSCVLCCECRKLSKEHGQVGKPRCGEFGAILRPGEAAS